MGVKKSIDAVKYKKAIDFSYNFYVGKYRKGAKLPYFIYMSSVSNLIIENNGTTDEAIAGLFHDLLEFNLNTTKANSIKNKFGAKVFSIVKQCSNTDLDKIKNQDWIDNKKKFIDSMTKKSQSTLLVSICDKLHSTNCIISDYNRIGKKLWKQFDQSSEDIIWYYKNLCKNFKKCLKNHKSLKDKLQRNVNEIDYFLKK